MRLVKGIASVVGVVVCLAILLILAGVGADWFHANGSLASAIILGGFSLIVLVGWLLEGGKK